jgi:hypothetical protein
MTIPAWTAAGVLPPIRPGESGNSADRSPYLVDLSLLVDRFAISPERKLILNGLLRFRAAFHQAGIVSGFQWLDGSFLEDVETLEHRPPRDMDVVTFFDLPAGQDQRSLMERHGSLFDPKQSKTTYVMDAYYVVLGKPMHQQQVNRVAYWYSMWSHRRNGLWKGFVQVDLNPAQDSAALALLNSDGGVRHD